MKVVEQGGVVEYATMEHFLRDVQRGQAWREKEHLVSPGYVAKMRGVTRQAVHDLLRRGRLSGYRIVDQGVWLIDLDSVKRIG